MQSIFYYNTMSSYINQKKNTILYNKKQKNLPSKPLQFQGEILLFNIDSFPTAN